MDSSNRLEIQIKQVKSLLSEFRKTKMKCLELCEKMNSELPKLQQYEVMEVTCTRKINTLDIHGVIQLKAQLLENLSQISEVERDMVYKTQKDSFKKAIKTPLFLNRQNIEQEDLGPFQIPTYNSKIQSNECKIERLANFVLSLGKSMNILRKFILGEWEWDQNFYKFEPEYLNIIRRIQMFKMRDEQLSEIIQRCYEKELSQILKKGQKQTTSQKDFEIIKIPRRTLESRQDSELKPQYHPISMIEPTRAVNLKKKQSQKTSQQKVKKQSNLQLTKQPSDTMPAINVNRVQEPQDHSKINRTFENSQNEEHHQSDNYVYMVKKISPETDFNTSIMSSITSLRSMRKKVLEDDIWDQFEKI